MRCSEATVYHNQYKKLLIVPGEQNNTEYHMSITETEEY